jgi:hypothetical protein
MAEDVKETKTPEQLPKPAELPRSTALHEQSDTNASSSKVESQVAAHHREDAARQAEYIKATQANWEVNDSDTKIERSDPVHSRYPDGTPVHEGDQPRKVTGPDPAADGAPHTVLKVDNVNNRIYKAREYGEGGTPVRDIDFTHPTYPNGTPRPNHTAPEQHRYIPNDPDNPKAGYKRGPGEPLDS